MGTPDKNFSELVGIVKSWFPRRTEPENVSRDFWMPDHSCRVCYECDSQFTVFNRRHHCRLCGRIFCGKCTANSIPAPSDDPKGRREDWERIRVCNFCFKQWKQELSAIDNGTQISSPGLSSSPSLISLISTKSAGTGYSSGANGLLVPYSSGPYQRQSAQVEPCSSKQDVISCGRNDSLADGGDQSPYKFGFCMNRSDDDDDEYGGYHSDSERRQFQSSDDYYGPLEFDDIENGYGSQNVLLFKENTNANADELDSSRFKNAGSQVSPLVDKLRDETRHDNCDECDASPIYGVENTDSEPVDFENNGLLWLPPEPEDEEDEREALLFDDDDEDAAGEWKTLRSPGSFGSGEYRSRERSSEEHRKAMKNVVDGHFRALVAQLLQVENLPVGEEDDEESWLDIVTSLSWEAATLLKPDTSEGGGMDPGGYVKVKCIACGHRDERYPFVNHPLYVMKHQIAETQGHGQSLDWTFQVDGLGYWNMVVKGVVCKKNVAHRRMTSKMKGPRFLILGGALEYQRVSNLLSSFDTLLQQEMDHLKMAVAKIVAHQPNVLLVEKSVSRFAQEYLLAKNISLVLNIKRPLLERVARCTGAQIVPSIDHLSSQKLGHCETFHVEKFFENHGSAGQGGKKLGKTLMFFEGCPKPLGCTVLLKGADGDELKKVKHVVQYGVFAAYHLALETSFLADEGASLPDLPLKSTLTVALPDKSSNTGKSISTIPGFMIPAINRAQPDSNIQNPNGVHTSDPSLLSNNPPAIEREVSLMSYALNGHSSPMHLNTSPFSSSSLPGQSISNPHLESSSCCSTEGNDKAGIEESYKANGSQFESCTMRDRHTVSSDAFGSHETSHGTGTANDDHIVAHTMIGNQLGPSESSFQQDDNFKDDQASTKEEFPPSPSDHQSILVSLSTRCVWKGTVCERAHLLRIKYYGSFDKPLGRFLRDHLFDQSFQCDICEMPAEAHVHCYTHRQGSLTISVKMLPEFLLPGECEGKIWMWHRCLRCPRINGFPPATRRVVMSDAAWGLSFGKFLELSFSNHAAASRAASCGHSLHRDCLRFYGFGKMVACFRYASIDVHSVYLPPSKLEFNYQHQEWIKNDANEVANWAEILFNEVSNALRRISEKRSGTGLFDSATEVSESRRCITGAEALLKKMKAEFEESLQKAWIREPKKGQPIIDIFEINRLRRYLLVQSCAWDRCLILIADMDSILSEELSSSVTKQKNLGSIDEPLEKSLAYKADKSDKNCDSMIQDFKSDKTIRVLYNNQQRLAEKEFDDRKGNSGCHSASMNIIVVPQSLEADACIRRSLSEGQFPITTNLSDTLDDAWKDENHRGSVMTQENGSTLPEAPVDSLPMVEAAAALSESKGCSIVVEDRGRQEEAQSFVPAGTIRGADHADDSMSWIEIPFFNFSCAFNKNSCAFAEYNPVYVSSLRELERQSGARLRIQVGINETPVPVYDDEPTSIISYALLSMDYHSQMSDERDRPKDSVDSSVSLPSYDSASFHPFQSFDENYTESFLSFGSTEDGILSMSGSRSSLISDPLVYTKAMHARVSFMEEGPSGKVKYTVTCYHARHFDSLRRTSCPSEMDFVRSLSRCKKWGAQGGKSNVFFAKTLDDRFIIKQVTKTELESFIKFAPEYFKYLSESIGMRSPTCLAKILGIYQVTSKHLKGGKESRMEVLVMENLLFQRNVMRLYDLKGSSRSRYNPDSSGANKVLLDQNLIEAMPTSPIFVGNKAKRLLERAVWNDTSFLASIDVMDYSLLVGVDEEKHELVLGIIDFMRQYTWDKHLETWVKASGILGGPKNSSPTVISPKQYKKRFRKAMSAYFLMVPDQWSPPSVIPNESHTDLAEENS